MSIWNRMNNPQLSEIIQKQFLVINEQITRCSDNKYNVFRLAKVRKKGITIFDFKINLLIANLLKRFYGFI
jgi:hypothetical protein